MAWHPQEFVVVHSLTDGVTFLAGLVTFRHCTFALVCLSHLLQITSLKWYWPLKLLHRFFTMYDFYV